MTEEGPNKLLIDALTTRFRAMLQEKAEQFQQVDDLKSNHTNDRSGDK